MSQCKRISVKMGGISEIKTFILKSIIVNVQVAIFNPSD